MCIRDSHYGDYPQIENGIGLSRMFVDDAMARIDEIREQGAVDACQAESARAADKESATESLRPVVIVTGELFAPVMEKIASTINCLVTGYSLQTSDPLSVIAVKNKFFGGKVNVTGLLTGYDIVEALAETAVGVQIDSETAKQTAKRPVLAIPDVLLNADGLLLDGYMPERIAGELGMEVAVIKSNGAEAVEEIVELVVGKH
jgi:NifB/MoaA-like Fe-S oxidoreductase